MKQVGLQKLRELFENCSLPDESAAWVDSIRRSSLARPPYGRIVEAIEKLQKKYKSSSVQYSALRVELSYATPAVEYETDERLRELCKGMAQMAPAAIYASDATVELDQSAVNVVASIEAAMHDYPLDEQ